MSDTKPLLLGYGQAIVDAHAAVAPDTIARLNLAHGQAHPVTADAVPAMLAALPELTHTAGGSVANTLAGVTALGGTARLIARHGRDPLGRQFAHDMRADEILLPLDPIDAATGLIVVLVTPDGERTMFGHAGASGRVRAADVTDADLAAAHTLMLEGYLLDHPGQDAEFVTLIERARAHATRTAFTPGAASIVAANQEAFYRVLAAGPDVVFANESEAVRLTGHGDAVAAAHALSREDTTTAFVTRGGAGVLIAGGGHLDHVPASRPEVLRDSTGAGDAFAAGVLHARALGWTHRAAARLGAVAAAQVLAVRGPRARTRLLRIAPARA